MNTDGFVEVASIDEIGPEGRHAIVGDEEVLLIRHEDKVYALGYLCSHQDMELEGGHVEDGGWTCPHHGARFALETGEALAMPAFEGVPTYEVKVDGGKVFVKEPVP